MEKWMCWGAMGVSGVLLLLFILDAIPAVQFPFGGLNFIVDAVSAAACAIVLYLAWDAWQDLR